MFTYEQGTGRMTRDGVYVAVGYSGAPMHVNKPEDEQLHALGASHAVCTRLTPL